MDFQKLTLKSQEAIGAAMEDARRRGNPEIYPEGDSILVDARDGELVFEKASVAEQATA